MRYLPLIGHKSLRINLCDDFVLLRSLPDSFCSRLWGANHKAARYVMLACDLFILLHQWNVEFCVFCDLDSELRIVEPPIVTFKLNMFRDFVLFFSLEHEVFGLWQHVGFQVCFLHHRSHCSKSFVTNLVQVCWTSSSVGFSCPFTFNWIDLPVLWEHLIHNDPIKLQHKVAQVHPPRPVGLFGFWCIFDIFLHSLVFFPIISLFTERSCPNTFTTPWISQPDQSQIVLGEISHVYDRVVMILQNTLLTLLGWLEGLLGCRRINAGYEKLLGIVAVEEIPHGGMINLGHCHILLYLKFINLTQTSRQIYQTFQNICFDGVFVISVQLNIGFFYQWDPKLLRIVTWAVDAISIVLLFFIRQQGINNDLYPFPVLEKLERDEASVKILFLHDQFLQVGQSRSHDWQCANEPTFGEYSVLDVDIQGFAGLVLLNYHEFGVFDDLLRSFPFQIFKLRCPIGQNGLVFVELSIRTRKIWISPLFIRVVG